MPYNTDSIKKQIFDKEPDEPLTAEEQDTIDEILVAITPGEEPLEVNIDPNSPEFERALEIAVNLEKENMESWKKLARAIGLDENYTYQVNEPEPRPKSRAMILRVTVAAAAFLIIAGFFLWNSTGVKPKYLTAATGIGEIRKVSLPDGSTVMLSAQSTIQYPEEFTNIERQVNLSGEASFTVSSDKTNPFRVTASKKNIVATGTEFNVKAYTEDTVVEATLIDGVITVDNGLEKKILKKGDQAVITNKQITINEKVNIENVTDWKQKLIIFKGKPLKSIMQQIAHFYTIKYKIEGTLSKLDLGGRIDATNDLKDVLTILNTHISEAEFKLNKDSTIIIVTIKQEHSQ